jgi:hypothetical protein
MMHARRKPQKQGSQDGACGFYAIGNALSLLAPEVSVDRIFHCVFRAYYRDLAAEHFLEGMGRVLVSRILLGAVKALETPLWTVSVGRPFWTSPPATLAAYKAALATHLGRPEPAVVILGYRYCRQIGGTSYEHWTVIRGLTRRTMRTFDSARERAMVPFSQCRISGSFRQHRSRPYLLRPTQTFLLARVAASS